MEAYGLLTLRLVIGLLFVGHGAQKLFGWFGGAGIFGTADWFRALRLRPALLWAAVAGLSEFTGGVLLALGLLMPLGPLAIMASMLVAIATVHWANGLWAEQAGVELPLVYLVVALTLALAGPGAYALDAMLAIALPMPLTLIGGLVLVIAGVGLALASRTDASAMNSPSHEGQAL